MKPITMPLIAATCAMSENETQSITQWEKTPVDEREACDREAGWK